MKKKQKNEMLIFIIFALFMIGFSQINFDSADIQKETNKKDIIPNASDAINSSRVFIDKDIVHRGIETLNITYNNTDFYPTTYNFIANITFSDDSQLNLTLEDPDLDEYWTVLFTPSIYNITGNTKITILANYSSGIENTPAIYDREFDLKNNLPKIGVFMNSTEIYRNETIKLDYLPSDIENKTMDLQWGVKLFDPTDDINPNITLVIKGEKIFSSEISIHNSYNVGEWRVEATCWDTEIEDNSSTVNSTFLVKNNEPVIDNILYQFEDEDPIQASIVDTLDIFRGLDKYLTVYVNASDVESNEMKLTISAADPITGENLLPSKYANIPLAVNQTNNFTSNVSFPLTSNVGLTELKIVVLEDDIIQDEYVQEIFIHNNAPILNNFTINDESGNQTMIKEGDWLSFKFGAEDDENSIEYVVISILYLDDFGVEQQLNYSTSYHGSDTEILIRGADLKIKTGIYTVYAYVFDSDGDSATCSPQTFGIEPNPRVDATAWLLFVIGIIIGLTFTFAGVYSYYRKKFEDFSDTTPEKSKERLKVSKKNHEDSDDFEETDEKSSTKSDKKSNKKKLIRKL